MQSIRPSHLFHTLCITPDTLAFNAHGNACFMESQLQLTPGNDDDDDDGGHVYSLGSTLSAALNFVVEPELEAEVGEEMEKLLQQMMEEKPEDRPLLEDLLTLAEARLSPTSPAAVCRKLSSVGRRVLSIESVSTFQGCFFSFIISTNALQLYLRCDPPPPPYPRYQLLSLHRPQMDEKAPGRRVNYNFSLSYFGGLGDPLKDVNECLPLLICSLFPLQWISLRELLTLCGRRLTVDELWALCYTCLSSLQTYTDFPAYLCLDTLHVGCDGEVLFLKPKNIGSRDAFYLAPEYQEHGIVTEKVCVYAVAAILWAAAKFSLSPNQKLAVPRKLKRLLMEMAKRTAIERPTIAAAKKSCRDYLSRRGTNAEAVWNNLISRVHPSRLAPVPGPVPHSFPEAFTSAATHFTPIILTNEWSSEEGGSRHIGVRPPESLLGLDMNLSLVPRPLRGQIAGPESVDGPFIKRLHAPGRPGPRDCGPPSSHFNGGSVLPDGALDRGVPRACSGQTNPGTQDSESIPPEVHPAKLLGGDRSLDGHLADEHEDIGLGMYLLMGIIIIKSARFHRILPNRRSAFFLFFSGGKCIFSLKDFQYPAFASVVKEKFGDLYWEDDLLAVLHCLVSCSPSPLAGSSEAVAMEGGGRESAGGSDKSPSEVEFPSGKGEDEEMSPDRSEEMEDSESLVSERLVSPGSRAEGPPAFSSGPTWASAFFGEECFGPEVIQYAVNLGQHTGSPGLDVKTQELQQQLMIETRNLKKTQNFFQKLIQQERKNKGENKQMLSKLKSQLEELRSKVVFLDCVKKYLEVLTKETLCPKVQQNVEYLHSYSLIFPYVHRSTVKSVAAMLSLLGLVAH
uniref:Kinase non-catalytic C-lobe domain containing 1 n=1 Tax=Gasterosteus aculeatus aculeatus TaxID=481459 RepID=A0AAQ4PEN2_GASAC